MSESFLNGRITLHAGDSREVLKTLADNSIDSIVCDPPYALVSISKRFGAANAAAVKVPEGGSGAYARASRGFMGKQWDTGETAFATDFWAECLRVLKPGGHVVSFSGTRTYHRMACAIEDAGFEIRDMLGYLYGSGFPKSHDVSKAIDKKNGIARPRIAGGCGSAGTIASVGMKPGEAISGEAMEWQGWGTALKPAQEPICLARKPLSEKTVAANVLKWGTGAINIDGCRVDGKPRTTHADGNRVTSISADVYLAGKKPHGPIEGAEGRWPANIIHDGSEEVLAGFPESEGGNWAGVQNGAAIWGGGQVGYSGDKQDAGTGSAARFFYTAKADASDRIGSKHPTVKPVDLMQWLCRLVTPKGGTILDPFAGTGTTGEAAFREGFNAVLIEREEEYQVDIRRRMALCLSGPDERARESIKARTAGQPIDAGPLFAGSDTPDGIEMVNT